jgi:hypothetical protein
MGDTVSRRKESPSFPFHLTTGSVGCVGDRDESSEALDNAPAAGSGGREFIPRPWSPLRLGMLVMLRSRLQSRDCSWWQRVADAAPVVTIVFRWAGVRVDRVVRVPVAASLGQTGP